MNRLVVIVAVLLGVTGVGIVLASQDDPWAADADAPWVVTQNERFLPPTWGPSVIRSVSPKGAWLYGYDELHQEQPTCFWNTSSWERTCVELEPGEAISFVAQFAWSPDDTALVTSTYQQTDDERHAYRLVWIDLASGDVTMLLQPEPGTYIRQTVFSPDGKQIAFLEIAADATISIRHIGYDGNGLKTVLTASDTVTLTDVNTLFWTAVDQLVFYSGPYESDTQGYFRVNSDGSGLERINAVAPGESETSILDVSVDGRFMIAQGMNETDACGPEYFKASSYVVDIERDEVAQVICAVYQQDTPGVRGIGLFSSTRALVMMGTSFLPDGSIIVLVEQRHGDRVATGLGVIDVASGQLAFVNKDMRRSIGLWDVSSGLDDGSVRVWAGGYWRNQLILRPASGPS